MQDPYARYASPDAATLSGEAIKALVEKMVATVKFGEKLVICVDSDVSTSQVTDLQEQLHEHGLRGVIIRGARAGTGFKGNVLLATSEEQRVDILARIGEMWAQQPNMKLTDLLQWYAGQEMEDDDFATAVEVHFQKITNGVFGTP
jgi:hypothetical protein